MGIGGKIYRQKICDDSFAWVREHLSDAPDGAVFIADELSKARGRSGRVWKNYPGQLTLTILLKPSKLLQIHAEDLGIRLNQLNMALALGILEPIKKYSIGLKWPNDFVFGDKKVGGMLLQAVWQQSHPCAIILGFSVNVNNKFVADDELATTATSLSEVVGQDLNVRELYFELLASLNKYYSIWANEKFDVIYRQWRGEQVLLGKQISVHKNDGTVVNGILRQTLPNGDAIILDENKKEHILPFYLIEKISLSV